jgi:hypothetical protein
MLGRSDVGCAAKGDRGAEGEDGATVDVASAVRRLWKVDADGRISAWAPGTTDPLGTCLSEDDELRQLMEEQQGYCRFSVISKKNLFEMTLDLQ